MCVCLIYECDFPFLNGNIVFTAATIVTKLDSSSIEEQQKHQGDQSLNVPMNGVANSSNSPIGSFCSFVWESFSGRGGKRRRRRPPRKLDVSNTCNQYSFIRFFASLSLSLSLFHTHIKIFGFHIFWWWVGWSVCTSSRRIIYSQCNCDRNE